MVHTYRRLAATALGALIGLTGPIVVTGDPAAAKAVRAARVTLTAAQKAFLAAVAPAARTSQRRYGVPASVVIAQAVLETGWGTSHLARNARNYFGMTCGPNGGGPVAVGCLVASDRVCDRSGCRPTAASFRVYRNMADSVADHGRLLKTNPRYKTAYQARKRPTTFVRRIARAGYATDPAYAARLIAIINKYKLNKYNKR